MKPASRNPLLACAALLALLGIVGVTLRNASSTPVSATAPRTIPEAKSIPTAPATGFAALQQLQQDGSYGSLAQAYQAAQAQPEAVGSPSADLGQATHTMATPWRGLRTYFGPDAVRVRPSQNENSAWAWDARLVSYGYGDTQHPIERADPIPVKNGIEYRRGSLTEWYLNDQRGLEQGFTLASRPQSGALGSAPSGPLTVTMAIETGLTPVLNVAADSVAFAGQEGEPVLHYAGLLAWDSTGQRLAAHIELRSPGSLALVVDDRRAQYPVTIDPLIYVETKLVAPDAAENDAFGKGIAISGNTVVVGAANDDTPAGADAGSAHVFVRNGASWIHQQKLTATDAGANQLFGISVGIVGETIVVGAGNGIASVTVVNGNTITFENIRAGAAYVFTRSGTVWTQQQKLNAPDPTLGAGFGASVALSGNTLLVGALNGDIPTAPDAGCAYVFVQTNGVWAHQKKLIASNGANGDSFGAAVALDGNLAVVGAPRGDTLAGADTGTAYIFARSGTTWTQIQRLAALPAATNNSRFGDAVAISGTDIVVGEPNSNEATGAAYVFFLNGDLWSFEAKLLADNPGPVQLFGSAVAISGNTIVAGALNAPTPNGSGTGAAYVFARSGSVWNLQQKLFPSDVANGDWFGWEVAMSADTIVATSQGRNSAAGADTGAAYIFENATVADLLVSQAADKTTVKQNDVITYTITVRNFGPNRAVNVSVDDTLPAGTVFKTAHANKGQFVAPPVDQNGVVTWNLGDTTSFSQETAQLVVTVVVRGKATLTNTVAVRSSTFDPNLANNTSVLSTSVGPGGPGNSNGAGGPPRK